MVRLISDELHDLADPAVDQLPVRAGAAARRLCRLHELLLDDGARVLEEGTADGRRMTLSS